METQFPELELQQELQRFTTQLTDRVTQASEVLMHSPHAQVRDEALRKNLLYFASALEIATGPYAAVNLLDMLVFVRLCRGALEEHWIPVLYGDDGRPLAEVFARSDEEVSALVERALGARVLAQATGLIEAWRAANAGQYRVEGVRLSDFASTAGRIAEKATEARGLVSSMKSAAQSANQAMALAERGLFLVHRLPFLWRLQARLGASEILSDSVQSLTEGPDSPVHKLATRARAVGRGTALLAATLSGLAMVTRAVRR